MPDAMMPPARYRRYAAMLPPGAAATTLKRETPPLCCFLYFSLFAPLMIFILLSPDVCCRLPWQTATRTDDTAMMPSVRCCRQRACAAMRRVHHTVIRTGSQPNRRVTLMRAAAERS